MSKTRTAQILVVVGLVAALVLPSSSVRAAFWQEISDVWFAPVQVCRDGISFGLAAPDAFSYDVVATLTDAPSGTDLLIDHERVTLAPGPVEDSDLSGERSHSRFFVIPWAETLPTGTSVTFDFVPVDDAGFSSDPSVEVTDCQLPDYLPLLLSS